MQMLIVDSQFKNSAFLILFSFSKDCTKVSLSTFQKSGNGSTLIWMGYLGVRFEVVKIMLETWNLVRKALLILLISAFFAQNIQFLAKMVHLLKAIVRQLC